MPLEEKYLELIRKAVPDAADPDALSRLSSLYDCVVATNEKINITSLVSPIDVTLKHIIDSLTLFLEPEFKKFLKKDKKVCDIGCGGGFPGLPVASLAPEMDLAMIDSTEKKITALAENSALLGLSQIRPVWGRGEELSSPKGLHREQYDLCISRAVARLPVLCELCLPFVKVGGIFIAMKGMKAKEEVEDSRKAIPMLGGKLKKITEISLDLSFAEEMDFSEEEKEKIREFSSALRYLVVIEKCKQTQPNFPRKWSQITKKTL
jgi:16S rRNA (guanine527-N7)-methyltransferase